MRPELFKIPGTNFPIPGYGAMVVLAFLLGTWWMTRRATKLKCDPDVILSLALIALVFGWFGGRAFYVAHYWKTQFAAQPWQIINLTAGGFEVYGGVLIGALFCCIYLMMRRLSLRIYADIAAPSLLLGMGIGRIGCHLVGCCFGATCPATLPWALQFPVLSPPQIEQWEDRISPMPAELIIVTPSGVAIPMPHEVLKLDDMQRLRNKLTGLNEEIEKAKASNNAFTLGKTLAVKEYLQSFLDHLDQFNLQPADLRAIAARQELRSVPVHPAQIYSAIGPILLAWLLNTFCYRRSRHGTVMALAMILYGVERFLEEMVRADNPVDTFGLTISQGVSIAVVAGGILWWLILTKMPRRSSWPGMPVKREAVSNATPQPA